MYLGSFDINDYVGIPAATHRFSSGAAYAPTVLTYSIYEEATDVGIDENVDMVVASPFDSVVGCYWIRRQLTAAAGFEAGKNYLVVVKATVDSVAAIQMHTFQVAAKVNASYIGGLAVPSGAIPAAVAGANGGLPTTNGTKVSQTVDLTASQIVFKKNVAFPYFKFPMYDSTGALKSGLTVTVELCADAATSFTAATNQPTEIGSTGYYVMSALTQAELNVANSAFKATASGALSTGYTILTQP